MKVVIEVISKGIVDNIFFTEKDFTHWVEHEKSPRVDVDADQMMVNRKYYGNNDWQEVFKWINNPIESETEDALHSVARSLMQGLDEKYGWEEPLMSLDEYLAHYYSELEQSDREDIEYVLKQF